MSDPKHSSHHDIFFKEFYTNPQFAVELFHLVFSKDERNAFDWSKLKAEKDTFPDKRADLIFSVPLKRKPNVRFRICLLLEHKSQYSRRLFSQLLVYQTLLIDQTFQATGRAMPVIPVLFYHGRRPWQWSVSFQEGFWGKAFSEIPVLCRKGMLNYDLRLLDAQDAKVARSLQDSKVRSRGALYLLREIWTFKPDVGSLERVLGLLKEFAGKRDDLILSALGYLFKAVPGMTREVWEQAERVAVGKGIIAKGGYMDVKERIKEEGRQEGRREGRREGQREGRRERDREVILNMLQKNADIPFIAEVTGLSVEEINKLKQRA